MTVFRIGHSYFPPDDSSCSPLKKTDRLVFVHSVKKLARSSHNISHRIFLFVAPDSNSALVKYKKDGVDKAWDAAILSANYFRKHSVSVADEEIGRKDIWTQLLEENSLDGLVNLKIGIYLEPVADQTTTQASASSSGGANAGVGGSVSNEKGPPLGNLESDLDARLHLVALRRLDVQKLGCSETVSDIISAIPQKRHF